MVATRIDLSEKERKYLETLTKTRTMQAQVVDRARILLLKADGLSFQAIADKMSISTRTIHLCLSKYNSGGINAALLDCPRPGRPVEISEEAKAWILHIACIRPGELGQPQELWSLKRLHEYIQKHAGEFGYPRLETVTKSYVQKLIKESEIRPFKVQHYCEMCASNLEAKTHQVLIVYKQIEMQSGQDGEICYDHDCQRVGSISLLTGIDLLTGKIIPLISDTHKSSDFIEFLKTLDNKYQAQDEMKIILDKYSTHGSKESKNFLATMPEGRMEFVFTPEHGSWINIIEYFFGKMIKQMLYEIQAKSKQEFIDRIYSYFREVNKEPILYHWK